MSALPPPTDFQAAIAATAPPRPLLSPGPGDWLRAPLWANRGLFGQVALAAVLINLLAMAAALFSMAVYNKVVPSGATGSMVALVTGMAFIIVFDFVLRGLRGYFVDVAGQNIDRVLGEQLFDRLLAMKLADRRGSNGAFAGLLREFETLREFFASATIAAIVDVPFVLLFIGVIALVAPPLALVPLLAVPIVIGVAWLAQPLLARLSAANLAESLGKQGVIVETIAGLETVKSSQAGPLLARRWQSAVAQQAAIALRQRSVAALAVNVAAVMQTIVYVATIALGVTLIAAGSLSMGAMVAASMLAGRAVAPLGQIAALLTRLSNTRDAYHALDRLMTGAGEIDHAPLRRATLSGRIAFRRVSFRYPGSPTLALDDVSFDIAPGDRVAIIGRVGSGKSTIARLVLGLYQPESGAVMVDDADVRQLHPDDLRANIGSVLQDVVLLSGSIRDNIALGDARIDDAAVLRAARLSGAHDFIGALPGGYDVTLADRGEGLSGGQRQAIAIARALAVADTALPRPILVLDEPTSAMDSGSEEALVSRLEAEVAGRTIVLVTHRQSMLRLATRVIVLDGGRIVTQGPRDDVLKSLAIA
ncbi:type I secretion system permease/ATPase [Polymorphobacter fuscus]|uniref:Type I secretion system permease/ATPase n=1 Tax=Sandarakinorhabdus fusca TaxID=1439888 RepID=A0A7C9GNJ9_9SPHN|nr:type I secretion system permease/ATPase [Polymorphobacter fuscus]KAB7647517.1 type I secretion system permease/ATPase [Polymorphobacter fuscus]MQT16777.1 type I secretion system permease/ATPase [Polymorphobacter fuscus]NJC09235.1 ATP-binding cassette subfamily C protein LapB [Polymorphobacter fuscus]